MPEQLPGCPAAKLRRVIGTVAAVVVAACESSVVDPRDFVTLAAAQRRWEARPFADYSYEIRIFCFCPPEITRWTKVSVREGDVIAVEAVEPDPDFPITDLRYWEPIDSILADLNQSMRDPSSDVYLDAIVVRYDATLGYPTSIEYRAKTNVLDGGSTYGLRNVQPLP